MKRFFLDTHIVIWLLTNNKQLNEDIRFDIEYPGGRKYFTSVYVILEVLHLKQLEKIKFNGTAKDLLGRLSDFNIEIDGITSNVFESLDKLPILTIKGDRHTDMIDRVIIAHCIAYKYTAISHDTKFPYYRKYGLELLEA